MLTRNNITYDKRKFKLISCKNPKCKNKIIRKKSNIYPLYCKKCRKNYYKIYKKSTLKN